MQNEGMKNKFIFSNYQNSSTTPQQDFNSFIKTYEDVIHSGLTKYLGRDSADYNDVKQEALIKAWSQYERFRKGIISSNGTLVTPGQFLYMITRDACCRFFVINKRKTAVNLSKAYEITDYSNNFSVQGEVPEIKAPQVYNLHKAVNALPEANQKYIKYFITGHTCKDIADREGGSDMTACRLRKQTIELLRKSMLGEGYQPPTDKFPELLRNMNLHDALDKYNLEKFRTSVRYKTTKKWFGTCKRICQLAAFNIGIDTKKVSDLTETEISKLIELTLNRTTSENTKRQYRIYLTSFLIYVSLRKKQSGGARPWTEAQKETKRRVDETVAFLKSDAKIDTTVVKYLAAKYNLTERKAKYIKEEAQARIKAENGTISVTQNCVLAFQEGYITPERKKRLDTVVEILKSDSAIDGSLYEYIAKKVGATRDVVKHDIRDARNLIKADGGVIKMTAKGSGRRGGCRDASGKFIRENNQPSKKVSAKVFQLNTYSKTYAHAK